MLPLPKPPHFWMVLLVIYIFGLTHGITKQMRREADLKSDSILFLSVMGIGIFTYYQGRSHDLVLSFVLWPAIIIAFVVVDQTLRAARLERLPRLVGWATLPVVVFGFMSAQLLVMGAPRLYTLALGNVVQPLSPEKLASTINIEFIRRHTQGVTEAVIIHPAQALLFLETGLVSSIQGPGIIEMVLAQDQNKMMKDILTSRPKQIFINVSSSGQPSKAYQSLFDIYQIEDQSTAGLALLTPRQ